MYICENCQKEHTGEYGSGRFCCKVCARGFSTKAKRSSINKQIGQKLKLTGHGDIRKICPACKKEFIRHWHKREQIYCSQKCAQKILKNDKDHLQKLQNNGGYREKGGRGKQGYYKGFYCNSSWELAFVIYCIEHNVIIERNKIGFKYIYENKSYKFYPDFIKNDGSYIEIKGYFDSKNKAKISQFPHKIDIIDKNKIQPFLDYVKTKYGEDYIKLYETR